MSGFDTDVAVIGSGFGGSVAALRLTEKGYRVTVFEAGRRWSDATLPVSTTDVRSFLWAPRLGWYGIQRITVLRHALVLSGAGVGGGSLVYANTLYRPPASFFADEQWSHVTDWGDELAAHYDIAQRMLGVAENPRMSPADEVIRQVADDMGVGETFRLTPVGVYFGQPGVTVADPYFGGAGPQRTGCTFCGACMSGCRVGAKNRLDKNYLFLAEQAGATVLPEQEVTEVRALPAGGFLIASRRPGSRGAGRAMTAEQVVVSAGTLGTQRLLQSMRRSRALPGISARLGYVTRTNSETLVGAKARTDDVDYSEGVAISSSFYPDSETHVEPVRYGKGDNTMGLFGTVLVDGGAARPRWQRTFLTIARNPLAFARIASLRMWSQRTIILLVMQARDNALRLVPRTGVLAGTLTSVHDGDTAPPTWIPQGNEVARRTARLIGGAPASSWNEVLFEMPATAHLLGGAVIGDSAATGVVDPYQRVYGQPGLHIADGSVVPANPGVNPSLTITALAERTFALWPNKGEQDPRPAVGAPYRRVDPVAPLRPVVPADAPAALRRAGLHPS